MIAALGRLADDTFARCDVCGVQISDRRLRFAPATDRCLDHLSLARHVPSVFLQSRAGPPGRGRLRADETENADGTDNGSDDDHFPC